MRPSFKEKFTKISTCRFRKQCTRPTQKRKCQPWENASDIQTNAKCTLFLGGGGPKETYQSAM